VVILSDALWRSRFAADPKIAGKTIGLNGADFTVVGVMPPEFEFPPRYRVALWVPLALVSTGVDWGARGTHWLGAVARMKPGVSLAAARADMAAVGRRLGETYREQSRSPIVRTLHDATYGETEGLLLALWGAVALVLLIACANVASLMLARTTERRRELAVRLALGAGRWQIARLVMIESLLLAAAGGAAGMMAAPWTLDLLMSLHGNPLGREDGVQVDAGVFFFCLLASLLTAVVSGLAPALLASRTDLQTSLNEGGETPQGMLRWRRSFWVVGETALALALLVGAGLVLQSLRGITEPHLGFNPRNLLTMRIDLPVTKYAKPEQQIEFYDRLLAKVEALPGVEAAASATRCRCSPATTTATSV
jgi:predicted permease